VRSVLHIGLALALAVAVPARADVVLPPAIAGSPWLKDLRKSMLAGRNLSDVQLQTLADAGEGLAAARYAKRLEERKDPAFLDDAAHYYSIAVYMGRDFAVPRLIALLGKDEVEFSRARLRNLRAVVERAARKGDQRATVGLAELLLQDIPFGKDVPRARELMLTAAEAGDAEAALRLALDLIKGADGLPPDPDAASHALDLAMSSPDPGVQAMVLTLQRQISDAPEPDLKPDVVSVDEAFVEEIGSMPSGEFPPRPRLRPATLEGPSP
jgi:hypothetical protein